MYKAYSTLLRKFACNIVIQICLFVFISTTLCAQQTAPRLDSNLSEKIYLQLNNKIFTTDESIWFKAIVTQAELHEPSKLSGVLYVELIDSSKNIKEKKRIKITNGMGSSFFELNKNYTPGNYMIRAYTKWNQNFGADFVFKEYIQIFSSSSMRKNKAITNLTLENKQDNSRWLKASLDPLAIDSLHKKKLKLYISLGDKKDSLILKKNKNKKYTFNYLIPEESQFIGLQIKTKNNVCESKTIVVDPNYLDLQFFPESGELTHGIPSKIAFKALNARGKGTNIKGQVVTNKDKIVTAFESNKLGMGNFLLYKVDTSITYYAKITSQRKDGLSIKYPLPKISSFGNVVSVTKKENKIVIKVFSNYFKNDSIYIRTACRGLDYYEIKGRLKEGYVTCSLPANGLPEGVITISLLDKNKKTIAERLYFNQRPESRIHISLATQKKNYKQRELTKLNIETVSIDGTPVNANISVLALSQKQLDPLPNNRQNILSYFLLSSDLKGVIENPAFYFEKGKNRHDDLDNLLLTQGWSKYKKKKPSNKLIYQPEKQLSISGNVKGLFSKKKKNINLTLVAFGNPKSFDQQKTDSLGRFKFYIQDYFGQYLKILIQSSNKSGKKRNYTIDLYEEKSPQIIFAPINTIQNLDSITNEYVKKNRKRKQIEDRFKISSDVNQLNEVIVTGYKMTPNRTKVAKTYGKPDVVINGKTILAKEPKWSYGLYSVLMFHFPKHIEIKNVSHGLYAQVLNPTFVTLVLVDGIPVLIENYSLIPSIPTSEVKSFEIIKNAKGFLNLYLSLFPGVHPLDAPKFGNIISIYTHAGKGIHGAQKPVGLLSTKVPVFSNSREFYAPKHKNITKTDWNKPDLRTLIHWQPEILVNNTGKSSCAFYNADVTGVVKIIVEAISTNGAIGYQELIYNVDKITE